MQTQTHGPSFRRPASKTCWARHALGPQAILLKGGRVPCGAVHLSDIEAVANAATALGDLCVDKVECDGLVRCGAKMEFLFHAAAASQGSVIMGCDEDEDATSVTTSTPHYQHPTTPRQQLPTHVSPPMTTIRRLYPIGFSSHSLSSPLRMFYVDPFLSTRTRFGPEPDLNPRSRSGFAALPGPDLQVRFRFRPEAAKPRPNRTSASLVPVVQ
jgi:hypothetical protein